MYKIGIDVGGTNTDAVLVDQTGTILKKIKEATTPDVYTGIENALAALLNDLSEEKTAIQYVMLGSTHCTNALIEGKNLDTLAHIRIGSPAADAIKPFPNWPVLLKKRVEKYIAYIGGGHEFDGRMMNSLDEQALRAALKTFRDSRAVSSISIAGVFSKVDPSHELKAQEIAHEVLGDIPVSLSHEVGGLGLLERESATAINASLVSVARKMVEGFERAVSRHGLTASLLFIAQNDGTLMSLDRVKRFPVLTLSSGPTNSLRGGGLLADVKNGIVVDVGGTTSDAGVLLDGFPRESGKHSEIGGVKTNFRMPDIVSVGLGGGTVVYCQGDKVIRIGPESVGYRLFKEGMSFGGRVLTLTDVAIACGKMTGIGGRITVTKDFTTRFSGWDTIKKQVEHFVTERIERIVDELKTKSGEVKIIFVGGGSAILGRTFSGVSEVIVPPHYEVANAYGVAMAPIGGEFESVVNLAQMSRKECIDKVMKQARKHAVDAGAEEDSIQIANIEDTPLAYLPNSSRIRVKVYGSPRISSR